LGSLKFKLGKNLKNRYRENDVHRDSKKREEKYPNHFKVGHHPFEFGLDSGQCCSEIEKAELYIGIITSPRYAKERFPKSNLCRCKIYVALPILRIGFI